MFSGGDWHYGLDTHADVGASKECLRANSSPSRTHPFRGNEILGTRALRTGSRTACRVVGIGIVLVMLVALAALPASGWAAPPDDGDIVVHVTKDGPTISADVDCPVKAPVAVVWDVLIDYDHMARFISNLETSIVRERDGDRLIVYQKGKARRGPLSFAFENEREINLIPYREIRSRLISGDLKASEFTTRIVDEGGGLHIVNSGRYTPKIWVPPLIGPAIIEAETRKQFGEIRAEILRRSNPQAAASQPQQRVANPN